MFSKIKESFMNFMFAAFYKHNAPLWQVFPFILFILGSLLHFEIINFNHLIVLSICYFSFCFFFTYYNMSKYFESEERWYQIIEQMKTEKDKEKLDTLIKELQTIPLITQRVETNYSLELCKDAFHSYFLNFFKK